MAPVRSQATVTVLGGWLVPFAVAVCRIAAALDRSRAAPMSVVWLATINMVRCQVAAARARPMAIRLLAASWDIATLGSVTQCYSIAVVTGGSDIGGLVGCSSSSSIISGFWDTEVSGLAASSGGAGLTTAQMQEIDTYVEVGWDFVGETTNGAAEIWQMPETGGYPRLSWFEGHEPVRPQGQGTADDPFLITNARELASMRYRPLGCYRLNADVDLTGIICEGSFVPWFEGRLDGNGHAVCYLNVQGSGSAGFFGCLGFDAVVVDLGLEEGLVENAGSRAGSLAWRNCGIVSRCYSTGHVTGDHRVGGLIGENYCSSIVTACRFTGTVTGQTSVGGLVGWHVGANVISNCYTFGVVTGSGAVGGLVGENDGDVMYSYSTALAIGQSHVGGLVGYNRYGRALHSFWDIQASGLTSSAAGIGLPTAHMQDIDTYLADGWDFIGETENGQEDIWWIEDGDYPRLWWELAEGS